jgi:hypothetical protein
VSEKPILFRGEMVRAILAGTKTQTRRIVKPQPSEHWSPRVGLYCPTVIDKRTGEEDAGPEVFGASDEDEGRVAKYAPGDLLWVRETHINLPSRVIYCADLTDDDDTFTRDIRRTPSIFMRRDHSRITLRVTGVRVERLQAITEADAMAEGIVCDGKHGWRSHPGDMRHNAPTHAYRALWESINGAGSWAANPWVWVYEFERVTT